LGHENSENVNNNVLIFTTLVLVVSNCSFLICSAFIFVREYLHDRKAAKTRKTTRLHLLNAQAIQNLSQIVPIKDENGNDGNDGNDDSEARFVPEEGRRKSVTKSHASFVHDEFHLHELGLQMRLKKRQEKAKRSTQLRLLARTRLKNSKALHKSTIFQELDDKEISLLIDQMSYKKRYKGDILCKQDDLSDNFYVIVAGKAVVTIHADDAHNSGDETEKVHDGDSAPVEVAVGNLSALQFFGESALLAVSDEEIPHRTATVRVSSEKLELLSLHRLNYLKLMKSTATKNMFHGKRDGGGGRGGGEMCSESASVLDRLKSVADQRSIENELIMKKAQQQGGSSSSSSGTKIVPLGRPKTNVPPIESDFSLSPRGDQEMGCV
jgi:CRP-like cAMP-binding protein